METQSFRIPVRVRMAEKRIEVCSVEEALRFLEEWTERRRGPVHRCALLVCMACVRGTMGPEEARRAFESFVHITGLSPPSYSTRHPQARQHARVGPAQ